MIRPAVPARWAAAKLLALAMLATPATTTATPATAPSTPARHAGADQDPANAAAQVPALRHDSVLANRRGVAAAPAPRPWREANEQVNRVGGWRTYLRESAPTPPSPASAPASTAPRSEVRP